MANVIKHKRGSGSDPSASDLILGELAIRTDTGKLFTKMDSGAIAEIAGGGSDIAINTLSSSSATGGGSATFNGSAYRFTLSAPPNVSAAQLLVSINGVIQKPVAGTGQPSEGFSVDGTDIILGDAPATGSDFFILTFKSLGVSEPADNSVTSAKIVDGAIVNADINASAAIAGSKIDPDFGNQIVECERIHITHHTPLIKLIDNNNDSDFDVMNQNGIFKIFDRTNSAARLTVASDGATAIQQGLDVGAGLDVTGNITGTGNLTIDTNTLHVDSSNNRVGIGTSSPDAMLHLSGTNPFIRFTDTVDSSHYAHIGHSDTSVFVLDADAANAHADSGIEFKVDNSSVMFLKNGGNVGIGTSPSTIFHVKTLNPDVYLENTGTGTGQLRVGHFTNGAFIGTYNDDGGGSDVLRLGTHSGDERMRITSDGNVGIGTTSPAAIFESRGSTGIMARFRDSANGIIDLKTTGTNNSDPVQIDGINRDLAFAINGSEHMRIDTSGNVGIGTTSMAGKLNVQGSAGGVALETTDATNSTFRISHPSAAVTLLSGGSSQHLALGTGFAEKMRINSSGDVGIGSTSPTEKLEINLGTDKIVQFTGGIGQIGNVAGVFAVNDAKSEIADFGIMGNTLKFASGTAASGAERMRIDSSGRMFLGLSSTSFPKRLNVQGSSGAIIALKNNDTTSYAADTNTSIEFGLNTGNTGNQVGACEIRAFKENGTNGNNARALSFYTGANGGSPQERIRINSSGNVGINQTDPSRSKLHVVGDDTDGDIVAKFKSGGGGASSKTYIALVSGYSDTANDTEGHARIGVQRAGSGNGSRLLFETQPSSGSTYINALKIDENGRTGVHYTSTTLTARFGVETTANTMVPVQINDSSNTSTLTHRILFSTGGTEVGRIRCTNSETQYNTSGSDRSMKKNFELWDEDVLSLFKNINPQKFNFIQEEDGAAKSKGFIAQEIANSFPEAYSKGEEEDDKYWFNPSGMVVYLMKALQEAVTRIEALEAK